MTTSLSNPPTKAATPAPAEKPATPAAAAPAQPQRSAAPSPEVPTTSTSPTPANVKVNGVNGDKAEREKSKKKSPKEKKAEREKAEKEAAAAKTTPAEGEKKEDAPPATVTSPGAANGEASASTSAPTEPAAASSPKPGSDGGLGVNVEGVHSPRTDSTGARTPTSRKPPRNPWTLFVRLAVPADETQLRDFFLDSKEGVSCLSHDSSFLLLLCVSVLMLMKLFVLDYARYVP